MLPPGGFMPFCHCALRRAGVCAERLPGVVTAFASSSASFFIFPIFILFFVTASLAWAQNAAPPAANSDATYQALRNVGLGAESVSVNNVELRREAATFHLRSGT